MSDIYVASKKNYFKGGIYDVLKTTIEYENVLKYIFNGKAGLS